MLGRFERATEVVSEANDRPQDAAIDRRLFTRKESDSEEEAGAADVEVGLELFAVHVWNEDKGVAAGALGAILSAIVN